MNIEYIVMYSTESKTSLKLIYNHNHRHIYKNIFWGINDKDLIVRKCLEHVSNGLIMVRLFTHAV